MILVVSLHGSLKSSHCAMDLLVNGHIYLSRSSPEHYYTLYTCSSLEIADIFTDLLGHIPTILNLLYIVAIKTLCIVMVESSLQRLDSLELLLNRVDIFLFEHLSIDRRLVGVGRIYIPCAEYNVIEICQRHDVLVVEILLILTASYADLIILSHRTDRLCQTLASHQDTGHEC